MAMRVADFERAKRRDLFHKAGSTVELFRLFGRDSLPARESFQPRSYEMKPLWLDQLQPLLVRKFAQKN